MLIFVLQQDAVSNLHKAKTNYITRQQELEKAREAAQKADGENQSQGTTAQAKTLEKKRKLEDEALHKVSIPLYGIIIEIVCVCGNRQDAIFL